MSKRVVALISAIIIFFGIVSIPKFDTQAAGGYTTSYSDGKVYIYKSGKYVDTISYYGGYVNSKVVIIDEIVYYTVRTKSGKNYLYFRNIDRKVSIFLKSLPNSYYCWDPVELYRGALYINAWNGSDNNACYRYVLETEVLVKICDAEYVKRCGRYIVCEPSATFGCPGPLMQIYVYNTSNTKVKQIEKGSCGYTIKGHVIYYAHNLKGKKYLSFNSANYFSVNTYDMKTGKTKVIVKKLKADSMGKMGSKYIYYKVNSWNGNKAKCYKYDIKAKKKIKISFSQYKAD